jgi:3-methyladenine DNA glycosylase/8-oxoguanine DNA glycosylase
MTKNARKHLSADPVMASLIEKIGHIPLRAKRLNLFHALTRSIVYQQLSGKAAATIFSRFVALFPDTEFPEPHHVKKTPLERLRSAGLSRPKASYILDLAERCHAGLLPSTEDCHNLADEEIIARLTEVRGIGRWSAEMILIFNLGRPDVSPSATSVCAAASKSPIANAKCPSPNNSPNSAPAGRPIAPPPPATSGALPTAIKSK